jgi:hypothetical protein
MDIAAAVDRHFDALMDAADRADEQRTDAQEQRRTFLEVNIWRDLARSPEDASEWIDENGLEFCHAENAFGRIAHFAAFMQTHGPLDAAALAAIGARVVAEVESLVNAAAEAV